MTRIKTNEHFSLLSLTLTFLACSSILGAQCAVGTNQSGTLSWAGNYSAFPKFGSRINPNAGWLTMSTSGIQYVYCAAGPTPSNCPTSGSDQAFSGADITNMNTAFTNWTNAKTANNSNLPFTNLSAISGSTTFTIQVNRLDPIAMLGVSGQVTTRGWNPVDYNNDGIADETRLYDAIIDINGSYHAADLTGILAHEIGHVMGLDDCASCNSTTVMTYAFPGPSGPSTCDNDRVHTVFP